MKTGNYELMDKAVFNCFLSMWSQNVPLLAFMIQEDTVTFAKELDVENCQVSRCLTSILEGKKSNLQDLVGRVEVCYTKHGCCAIGKHFFQLFCQIMRKTLTKWTSLGCFINAFQTKYTNWNKKCYGRKLSKIWITDIATANALDDRLTMFFIGKTKRQSASRL